MDTQGFLIQAEVTSADNSNSKGLRSLLRSKRLSGLKKIWVDMGYQGEENKNRAMKKEIELEVVKRPPARKRIYNENWEAEWIPVEREFKILPKRWIVERTFAWIGKYRRMSKDYESYSKTSETMIFLCMTRTMIKRYESIC